MSSAVAELDGILQSMLELKPPGVSGPKIASITSLCNANVQSETVLIQKVYTHFKKAPGNKKLGVLYVVDSVSRQWLDQARKAGQTLGSSATDGTFAAGVNHVTELLPSFMTDIIAVAPEEQKAKIKKLIDIWERGNTFPAAMLSGFKAKLEAPAAIAGRSTTPTGTPPQNFAMTGLNAPAAAQPAPDTSSILANLQALANMTKSNSPAMPMGNPSQGSSSNVSFPQTAFPQNVPSVNAALSMQQPAQAVNTPTPVNGGVISYGSGGGLPQNLFSNGQLNQIPQSMMLQNNAPSADGGLQQQLQILQALKVQGIPEQQWPALLSVLMANQSAGAPAASVSTLAQNAAYGQQADSSRDRNGYDTYMRSPPSRYRGGRSRSRSPNGWDRRRDASPQPRRGSPVYGEYSTGDRNGRNNNSGGGDGGGRRGGNKGGRGNGFRQRSPDRFAGRRSPSPRGRQEHSLPPPGEKFIEWDHSMGEGMIKVLSRTLFVGGVTCSENDLRAIFSEFGRVQTCIVNIDKRHAFVKMVTRAEAQQAKNEMEHYKSDSMQLRTRWGVGFGPRPCSDYQTGISIIPIERLTDADRKWMLSAEYGGSGGKGIESGMVVEEPDIEIGAGVSSKAISRRMQTDKSGSLGPRSTREPPESRQQEESSHHQSSGGGSRYRQPDQHDERDNNSNNVGVAPTVPSFGFPFQVLPNGMPMFPPGFVMPGQTPAQPPPPGAT